MPLTDLTNTTWKFNDTIDFSSFDWPSTGYQTKNFSVKFTSNGANYSRIAATRTASNYSLVQYGYTTKYQTNWDVPWQNYLERAITFTGGTAVTDPTLIAWIESTAERIYTAYKVDEPDLTAIADAIRTKGGTSAPLTFPDGFVNAIGDISTSDQWEMPYSSEVEGTTTLTVPTSCEKIRPYFYYQPKRRLPEAYQQVEYIESTGTQYINTRINATALFHATILGNFTSYTSGFPTILGSDDQNLATGKYNVMFGRGTSGFYCQNMVVSSGSDYIYSSKTADNNEHLFDVDVTPSKTTLKIDTTENSLSQPPSVMNDAPLGLFARYAKKTNTYGSYVNFRLKTITIYNGGLLAFDGVPCYRKSDGVRGIYNLADGAFYVNQGTGTFNIGPDVSIPYDAATPHAADLSVSEIGEYAFFNTDLTTLTLRSDSVVTLGDHAFDGTPIADGTGNIYVPSSLVSAYQSAWPDYASIIGAIQ